MATATELTLEEELPPLDEIASQRGWTFVRLAMTSFAIKLPAKDGSWFWVLVECDDYPVLPPAFSWYEVDSGGRHRPQDTPRGSGFLHSSGRICAPWNRLAYKSCDPEGPHSDWQLANWKSNPKTGGTRTICAMILRIFVELTGPRYSGRMAA